MIATNAIEPLSIDEHKRIRGTIKTFMALACIEIIVCLIMDVAIINSNYWSWRNAWYLVIPFAGMLPGYLWIARKYVMFPADLKTNHKIVADTTVLRKKKWGWFDMDARGGLSNVMMGSAYYLYIPDDSKRSGRRRFRILMDAYDALQAGQKIRVAWLPKSGQILSIDTDGGFHWVAWDRRSGDHG